MMTERQQVAKRIRTVERTLKGEWGIGGSLDWIVRTTIVVLEDPMKDFFRRFGNTLKISFESGMMLGKEMAERDVSV